MKFTFLLYMMKRQMTAALKNSSEFREKAAEKDFTIQIKTADGKRGRYFSFSSGEVKSSRGLHQSPDVALVWADAATGFSVMASGSNKATMKALQEGKLKIEGDGQLALHFTGIAKAMMQKGKKG